jgi:hypothetical protein
MVHILSGNSLYVLLYPIHLSSIYHLLYHVYLMYVMYVVCVMYVMFVDVVKPRDIVLSIVCLSNGLSNALSNVCVCRWVPPTSSGEAQI